MEQSEDFESVLSKEIATGEGSSFSSLTKQISSVILHDDQSVLYKNELVVHDDQSVLHKTQSVVYEGQSVSTDNEIEDLPNSGGDLQASEERNFYALYEEILDFIKHKTEMSDETICSGIETVISSFYYDRGNHFSDVQLGQYKNICGYLFRLGTLHAGLVRHSTLGAIRNCLLLEHVCLEQKNPLMVVSLGGGPGNDVVGFCSALHELGFDEQRLLEFIVVDAVKQWSVCIEMVPYLMTNKDLGSVSEMFRRGVVSMKFVHAKLPVYQQENRTCFDALANSDIILVVRLLSSMKGYTPSQVIQNIRQVIKNGALVLYIDSPFNLYQWKGFDVLYQSPPDEIFQLQQQHRKFGKFESSQTKARLAVLTKSSSKDLWTLAPEPTSPNFSLNGFKQM